MSDPSQLRAGDADRERLIEELHEHTVAGRLSAEELEERVGGAYRSSTYADLDALRADLPVSASTVALELSKRKSRLRRRLLQEAGGALGASAVCVGIWLAAGADATNFWPGWVIAFTMLPFLRDGWRLLGPASDMETVEARLQSRRNRQLTRGRRHRARYRGLPWP